MSRSNENVTTKFYYLFLVIGHEGAIARKLEFKSNATLVIGPKEGIYSSYNLYKIKS